MKKTVIAGLIALTSASAFAATDIFAALDVNEATSMFQYIYQETIIFPILSFCSSR